MVKQKKNKIKRREIRSTEVVRGYRGRNATPGSPINGPCDLLV